MNRDPLVELPPELAPPGADLKSAGSARFVLGIDGGATKTLAALLDLRSGRCTWGKRGRATKTPSAPRAAVEALLEAADEAIERAGIASAELDAAVLALAGTDTDAVARHVHAARTERWIVVNDVVAAWATATGAGPGIGVISGTGSQRVRRGRGRARLAGRRMGAPARRRGQRLLAGDPSRSRRRCATARTPGPRPR